MSIQPTRAEYRQVADILRHEIEDGTYAPGSTLPSEPRLAERFGVSRPTINKGVAILRSEGLVHVERGQGVTVRHIRAIPRVVPRRFERGFRESNGARGAFAAECASVGLDSHTDVEVSRVVPPAAVAAIFALPGGMQMVRRRRRMYAGTTPAQLADSYIPLRIAEGADLETADTGPGGTFSRMADDGNPVTRMAETVRVRTPEPEEAAFLDMEEEQRVYAITRTSWDATRAAVEVTLHVLPTHLHELTYEWPLDG